MKESIDLNFEENIEIVHMFHDYLLENSYFNGEVIVVDGGYSYK